MEREILCGADRRIRDIRTREITVKVTDGRGRPVPGALVNVEQISHAFLFGCNFFLLDQFPDAEEGEKYRGQFTGLLNYATLPFYWGGYEPERGKTSQARLDRMAGWCKDHGVVTKGHPLVWHETTPKWLTDKDDVVKLLRERVRSIIRHFAATIPFWDVVNEATVSHNFDNPVGRWIAKRGAAACIRDSLRWAHAAAPSAKLLVNDFNVSPAYEALLGDLRDADAPFHAIGIQSHMHGKRWPIRRAWKVCETYGRFGLPVHFTELTVLSGARKTDNDWQSFHPGWVSTRVGERIQDNYVKKFYTTLFSHPAVEAITWWDFADRSSWQGAPSGFVRTDMSPKPAYKSLMKLVKGKWWTRYSGRTNRNGEVKLRAFFGRHQVTAAAAGSQTAARLDVTRTGGGSSTIRLTR